MLRGTAFAHQAYYTKGLVPDTLFVFFDGDGSPWVNNGTRAAQDPTPRVTLALHLAVHSDASVLYLCRPCYCGATGEACSAELWTSRRYSPEVVDSMAAALNAFLATHHFSEVALIGYSGGGVLSVLVAPRVPSVRFVVTAAANLDIAAWTGYHGYLPLDGSLNPADEPALPPRVQEWHLVGGQDRNTPPGLNDRYWGRVRADQVWTYPQFDHVCCWVEQWPQIFARLRAAMVESGSARPLQRIDGLQQRSIAVIELRLALEDPQLFE